MKMIGEVIMKRIKTMMDSNDKEDQKEEYDKSKETSQ
jgi:hypothetical protein